MKISQNNSDVIVVGGGVIGLSISYQLLRGSLDVTTIFPKIGDKESASRAAGAMLGAFGEITADDAEQENAEFAFRLAAQRHYPEWLQEISDRAHQKIHQSYSTFIIANNDGLRDRASIKRMKAEAERVSEPAEWVEPEDVPGLKTSPHHSPNLCLHLKNENSVDSEQLLDALVTIVTEFNNSTVIDDYVVSINKHHDNWVVKTKDGKEMSAPHVVLAAGSRSFEFLDAELCRAAELPDLYFGKGVSCIISRAPVIPQTIRTPNRAFACGIHVVPRGSGNLYVGATNCMGVDYELETGIQPTELHSLFDETIHQINIDIRTAKIEEMRIGYRPIAMFRRPVIGESALPGLHVATGTYRNGVLMAPLVAEIIADTLGVASSRQRIRNPFPVSSRLDPAAQIDLNKLVNIGVRDIVAFLHEPRGALPYNRAQELETYVKKLFQMSISNDAHHLDLRHKIRDRLQEAPFNETMHKLFYEIIQPTE